MLKRGCCGGEFIQAGKQYYGCASARNKGTCDNPLTIRREDLETRVLSGLKDQLLHPDLIAEFVRAYQEETNQLAGTIKQDRVKAEQASDKVTKQSDRIIDSIAVGMFHPSMKGKMTALEKRKTEIETELQSSTNDTPVLLHPSLADRYKEQVANLTNALDNNSTKAEATSIIRSLLSEIRLIPEGDTLVIELVGELAGLLQLGTPKSKQGHPKVACSTVVVAGAGFEPATFRL
ncbi:hypothetical protein O2N63_02040 [Aliiroseovarius sp. KMU-50]|uniref:Recombinase zinc beta ribbon domain-containing protein n=1 Tax=Aliiroseovarius salicola TaxID=3009082 RepID=A0ABT4VX89_9RHOB|nr:recombinase zinc beta ribbon domain-containing protein [Aliiroseovarius sp. KMU-50]MDA5092861.1 hypothetical protein [Aliiroseovarius sp. KMU-50]